MAFLRVTDRDSGAVRCFNTDYVIELQPDEEGATLWYVSYATAGQPVSRLVDTRESLDELLAQVGGGAPQRASGSRGTMPGRARPAAPA